MKMINKLERKFGRYAIKNLSLYLILGYVIGYLLLMFAPQVLSKLILVPAFVMQGEVWRLLTWVITPPELSVSIFTIIMLFFYYSIGNLLERSIGTFLYNLYIFGGMFLTMAGTMIAYFIFRCHGILISISYPVIISVCPYFWQSQLVIRICRYCMQ